MEAIKNSANLVKKDGYYYIAIYHKVEGMFGSRFWLKVKKLNNFLPKMGKHICELIYTLVYFAVNLIYLKNPLKKIKNYKSHRGMSWRTDVTDWLGGYPYEFATVEEVLEFVRKNFHDFNLVNLKRTNRLANNWYLFKVNKS